MELTKKHLEYHTGDGYSYCKEVGIYVVDSDRGKVKFTELSKARKYYDSLFENKGIWSGCELLESHILVDNNIKDLIDNEEIPF